MLNEVYGYGCKKEADSGPRVRDALAVEDAEHKQQLFKAKVRIGEKVSKPILSLLEMVDKGHSIWLDREDGLTMYPSRDFDRPIKLARRNNTLGMHAKAFCTAKEAVQFVAGEVCAGEEDVDMGAEFVRESYRPGEAAGSLAYQVPAAPAPVVVLRWFSHHHRLRL